MRISDWSSDVCSSDLEPLALLGGQPPAAAVGAGLERDAFGLRLQEVPTERPTGEASLQVVDLELVGVAFVFFGEQQAIVVRIAPDRLDHAQRALGAGVAEGAQAADGQAVARRRDRETVHEIGRASGRERVCQYV